VKYILLEDKKEVDYFKMKYKFGDEKFTSRLKAVDRRKVLNLSIKKAGDINLVNKVLKLKSGGYIIRAYTKKK